MSKHQLVNAEINIRDIDLINSTMSKAEKGEYIKHGLANHIAELIISNNLGTLTEHPGDDPLSKRFRLSLVVVNQGDYNELRDAIFRNDFQIIKDGEVKPLITLL